MRTSEVRNSGYQFQEGWQVATITFAQFGDWNGVKFLDVWFHNFPETMNMRVYETCNKESGEEFAIGNLFRFANAGTCGTGLIGNSGKIVKIHDNPDVLIGKKLNIFLYREGSGYYRILPRVSPAEPFENHLEKILEAHISCFKDKAEYYYEHYVATKFTVESESTPATDAAASTY